MRPFLTMAFYQNGICFLDLESAKANFISGIQGIEQRADAVKLLNSMNATELQAFFPDCYHGSQLFNEILMALIPIVCLLLAMRLIKRAAFL